MILLKNKHIHLAEDFSDNIPILFPNLLPSYETETDGKGLPVRSNLYKIVLHYIP